MAKHLVLRGGACPSPNYGRMLGSDFVASLTYLLVGGVNALSGAALGAATAVGASTALRRKHIIVGAAVGGGVGLVAGAYPALLAQRATLRDAGCPDASLGRLLGYHVARWGIGGALGVAARKIEPTVLPSVATLGWIFGAPVLGQAIVTSRS